MEITDALSVEHLQEIVSDSSVSTPVAASRGYRTLYGTGEDRDFLESLGYRPVIHARDETYPALLIPMRGMDGEIRNHQIKPAVPRTRLKEDGTRVPIKYETPPGTANVVDVPVATAQLLREDPNRPVWITEGMKKTDSLVTQGMAALGLLGVFSWRHKHGVVGDWEEIPIKGRPAVICFDSDASSNRNVQLAMSRLGEWLKSRGASTVHYLVVPGKVGETSVKGVDDYFAAGGTLEDLHAAATTVPPGATEKDAAFTDAVLVEDLAEALDGRFCWAHGLGWLAWSGRVWRDVSDVEPLEAVRQWATAQFDAALEEQKNDRAKNLAPRIAGWRAILGKTRLTALRDLSRGLLQRSAEDFDGNPDLLTAENGTVHLPSGKLLPFDPEHCITKMCAADYIPGFRHVQWDAALEAVPADIRPWFQDRLGQALTGYMTPDHMMVIAHGGGSNGKSTVMEIVRKTLAGYGVLVSERVLMASPDAHPTELMDFKGARYALMEETPEARHLNVQRLKQTVGTPTIKARRIRMDPVEFIASHSFFINTNYRPTVTETDHGTWRRLSLMPWPYTFRKPGQPLTGPYDRPGDPALSYAAGDRLVRCAALRWMVDGAQAWYARGRMMLPQPERVERETRDWRAETDLILGFSDDTLTFREGAFTQTQTMLKTFNEWSGERGHRPWNDRTFASRFGAHDIVRAAKVEQGRFSVDRKQQRGWMGVEIRTEGVDPFTGERDGPPASEPPREYGGCVCGSTSTGQGQHAEYCGFNRAEQREARGETPVALGFDLETASADQLFTGGHEGPFVRLAGVAYDDAHQIECSIEPSGHYPPDPFRTTLGDLNAADVIYGHNILGFDLLALAHHHGADYDALAAKAVDTLVLARLIDPPLSKGMPNGYYGLDAVAQRLGHEGKTDDLKALSKRHGGFDRIPLDSREYQDYLRGDLAATKAVYEGLGWNPMRKGAGLDDYAEREMKIVALQNRMTLNGWAVDAGLLAERVAHEDAQRAAAVTELHERYGVPLAKPDRFKLRPKAQWPDEWYAAKSVAFMRRYTSIFPEGAVARGLAVRIPGEVYKSPWATDAGREALIAAFAAAGATTYPTSAKTGTLLISSDAMGEESWYDADRKQSMPGMLQIHGDKPGVRAVVETLGLATGARVKYGEIAGYVTSQGRVHAGVGAAQGSGRWAMVKPSLTNMGKRGAAGEERAVMVADPGHVLIACDLSQVDVRAIAGLCQDPALIARLQPGMDYHAEMATIYFGDPSRRDDGKPISHGLNYGQGWYAIAERNGLDPALVQRAMQQRREAFPVQMQWTEGVVALAASGALLDNGFGRLMRPDPERAGTQGPALMGQGAARDIMTESLLRLVKYAEDKELNVRPYLRAVVHDEGVLSVPEGEAELWAQILKEAFTWEWRGVPILCDVSKPSFRWSGCK